MYNFCLKKKKNNNMMHAQCQSFNSQRFTILCVDVVVYHVWLTMYLANEHELTIFSVPICVFLHYMTATTAQHINLSTFISMTSLYAINFIARCGFIAKSSCVFYVPFRIGVRQQHQKNNPKTKQYKTQSMPCATLNNLS